MTPLAQQRCFQHAQREAAARCTGCHHFFCRECIAEHDGRLFCAACLRQLSQKSPAARRNFAGVSRLLQCAAALLLAWFFFFLIGEALLSIPASFHEGTLWNASE